MRQLNLEIFFMRLGEQGLQRGATSTISLQQVERWLAGATTNPNETSKKAEAEDDVGAKMTALPPWRQRLTEYERIPGLLYALSRVAEAMCAPFWWSFQETAGQRAHILANGTVCYLNTGAREIGVTANHVLTAYLQHLTEHGEKVECQFGGSTISPENRVISQSSVWDIATIEVPEVFVTAAVLTTRIQHKALAWPPASTQKGDLVVYGGYPGVLRKDKVQTADFPFEWIAGGISDVSSHTIVLEPDFKTLTWLNPEAGKEFNRDVRGMSGGPVFRLVEPFLRLELIAFIYELALGEAILARPAHLVAANGHVAN